MKYVIVGSNMRPVDTLKERWRRLAETKGTSESFPIYDDLSKIIEESHDKDKINKCIVIDSLPIIPIDNREHKRLKKRRKHAHQ